MIKKSINTLVFLLFVLTGFAQQIVLEETIQNILTLDKGNNVWVDSILSKHEKLSGTTPKKTPLVLKYSLTVRAIARPQSRTQVLILFNYSGDDTTVSYRGMPLGYALIPHSMSFVEHRLDDQGKIVESFAVRNARLAREAVLGDFVLNGSYTKDNLLFKITDRSFQIDSTIFYQYEDAIALIDDYYYANDDVEKMHRLMDAIDLSDFESYGRAGESIVEASNFINHINSLRLVEALELSKHDPLTLQNKLSSLENRIEDTFKALKIMQTDLDLKLYNRGVVHWNNKQIDSAQFYFEASVKVNPYLSPGHLMLARIKFINEEYAGAKEELKGIISNQYPDPETLQGAYELLGRLYLVLAEKGQLSYRNKNFKDAAFFLSEALEICGNIKEIACKAELFDMLKGISQTEYKTTLSSISEFLKAEDLPNADRTFRSVLEMTSRGTYIFRDLKEENNLRLTIGNQLVKMAQSNFPISIDTVTGAGLFGATLMLDRQANYYSVNYDPMVPGKYSDIYFQFRWNAAVSLDKSQFPAEAEDILFELSDFSFRANTAPRFDPNLILTRLNNACGLDTSYFQELAKAQKSLANRNFAESVDQFEKAGNMLTRSGCNFGFSRTRQAGLSFSGASAYQTEMNKAEKAKKDNSLPVFLISYQRAENLFNQEQLGKFGMVHTPLAELVRESNELPLIFEAAYFYAARGAYEFALSFALKCVESKFETKRVNELQQIIGESLAEKYFSLYRHIDTELILDYYLANEKSLRATRNAFLKKWSSLNY